jgi:hypothetical protein
LEKLLAGRVAPFVDFDHEGKAPAAIPRRFRWVPGKGVMLELLWTHSGKQSVQGKDAFSSPLVQPH